MRVQIHPLSALKNFKVFWLSIFSVATFLFFLLIYLFSKLFKKTSQFRFLPGPVKRFFETIVKALKSVLNFMSGYKEDTINRVSLIDLAIRNMLFKKNRAFITIGGMALGIGSIVFLVSLGYGVNKLVVDRVARLEEMQQADVNTLPGNDSKITDLSLSQFLEFEHVKLALPQIAVVAKINYLNSSSDMAVYGVTAEYLKQSAIRPSYGKVFDNNELSQVAPNKPQVAGISTQADEQSDDLVLSHLSENDQDTIATVEYEILADEWVRVRSGPKKDAEILGYTRQVSNRQTGEEVWGETYSGSEKGAQEREETSTIQGKWIHSVVAVWQEQCPIESDTHCDKKEYQPVLEVDGTQKIVSGYFAQVSANVIAQVTRQPGVLGLTTENLDDQLEQDTTLLAQANSSDAITSSDTTTSLPNTSTSTATGTNDIDIATLTSLIDASDEADLAAIASEAAGIKSQQVKTVPLDASASKVAVVNTAMLGILGLQPQEAVGKTFDASFIVVGTLLDNDEKIESVPTPYTIIGVIQDDSSPFFYVPFLDLRKLGITNYSQAKIVVDDQINLASARTKIESLGFATNSTADTVEQIDRLFATLRTVLALLGMVALAVASLGMFNTLTVSLLERTREVGLMKAMGMKSHEVRELFLTESMIMGFLGGISGISMGFLAGKLLSVLISSYAITKGQGFIDVSYIPSTFIVVVFSLSMVVGIVTGIYPARRATSISALNALRYE